MTAPNKRPTSIYCITNSANGKKYIGQTVSPVSKRWSDHRYQAFKKQMALPLHKVIRKYGEVAQYILDNPDKTNQDLAALFDLDVTSVLGIKKRKSYKHLKSTASDEQWSVHHSRSRGNKKTKLTVVIGELNNVHSLRFKGS